MIINIVFLLLGLGLLLYGIKVKLKMWIVIGMIFIGCALFSAFIDYKTTGTLLSTDPDHRLPFVLDHFM